MRRTGIFVMLSFSVALLVVCAAATNVKAAREREHNRQVIVWDDCDPTDPAWAPTQGCTRAEGTVTFAEFNAYRLSPLAPSVVGHPAWWFEPGFMTVTAGKNIQVRNEGGRVHTFTRVAQFGGGRVPPLNTSQPGVPPLTAAPECLSANVVELPGGSKTVIEGLPAGDHRFQCCIHPWMRTLIKVSDR